MVTKAKKPGTAVAKWDEALAARAAMAKKTESSVSTGSFISVKGAQMTYNGNPVDGNKMDVVILDAIMENKMYSGKYDPNNAQAPACYAFGRDEDEMKPHEKVEEPFAEACAECLNNQWDSGEGGRGKACKNIRRLALIPADAAESAEGVENADVAYLEVPVTSVKAWAGFVNGVTGAGKAPLQFVTEISVVPDTKTQLKVSFKAKQEIEDGDVIGALLDKAEIVEKGIDFPYQAFESAPVRAPARSARRAPPAKPLGKAQAGKPSPRRKF